jgi:hypothetical protein
MTSACKPTAPNPAPHASSSSVAAYQHCYGDIDNNETYRYFASLDYIKASQGLEAHLYPPGGLLAALTAADAAMGSQAEGLGHSLAEREAPEATAGGPALGAFGPRSRSAFSSTELSMAGHWM